MAHRMVDLRIPTTPRGSIREQAAAAIGPDRTLVGAYSVLTGRAPGTDGCLPAAVTAFFGYVFIPLGVVWAMLRVSRRKFRVVVVTDETLELWQPSATGRPERCVARWAGYDRLGPLQPGGDTKVDIDGVTYQVPLASVDEARKVQRLIRGV